jgi:pilus assembly protein CpaB
MNRTALLGSLFIVAIGVVLLVMYERRFEDQSAGGAEVPVLMAVQDIPLGTVVTERMLGVRKVREAYVESRHVRADDVSRIVGVRLSMEVKAGESLLWSDLAVQVGERRDLSALVKSGMRAITIQTDDTSTFGGLLRPGDHIDVFMTAARGTGRETRATVPLIQNALVLAVGRDTGETQEGPQGRPAADSQVTLGVTLTQAQALTLAEDRGRLTLALRSPDDTAVLAEHATTTVASVLEPERAP